MEGYFSTGQGPLRAVEQMEEEEVILMLLCILPVNHFNASFLPYLV